MVVLLCTVVVWLLDGMLSSWNGIHLRFHASCNE